MYTLKIEAPTFAELKNKLQEKLAELGPTANVVVSLAQDSTAAPNEAAASQAAPADTTDEASGKRGRGRPKKSGAVTEATSSPQSNAATAPVSAPTEPVAEANSTAPVTKEQVMEAVKGLTTTAGLPAAKDALAAVGATRISEVKEADYSKLLAKCQELQAQHAAKAVQG